MTIRANVDPRALDQRITFERNTPTQAAGGDMEDSWADLKETWARVDGAKASAAEPSIGGEIISRYDYTVWVRAELIARYSITVLDRIRWKGKRLNIKDMPDQQLRGNLIALFCNTGLNQG
jgi:head-tail adaptor